MGMLPSFEAFCAHVGKELDFAETADSTVTLDELGLDSLGMLELLVAIEDLGVEIEDGLVGPATSLAQLYEVFVALGQSQ